METKPLELKSPQETQTGSRSLLYSLFSRSFRFPQPELYESVKAGQFSEQIQASIANLPHNGLKAGELGRGMGVDYDKFQSNYIGLFEVGGESGPPAPLYEGEYGGGRLKVMEEVLRFYHHFGLRLSTEKRDRPDHLATEMEFMHLLTFKEAEALLQGKTKAAYVNAQRDFLRYHVGDLVSSVSRRLGNRAVPFYQDLVALANTFCQNELAFLLNVDQGG
ncbi:MAG: molecular chaperone TorD family protein [Deltaproteobacteria bacterium]|nr:molecular chaperone TorD family protein [Deltaproteobacteria bacterium]